MDLKILEELVKNTVEEEIKKIQKTWVIEKLQKEISSQFQEAWEEHFASLKGSLMKEFLSQWEDKISERAEYWDDWAKDLLKSYKRFGSEYFTLFSRRLQTKVEEFNGLLIETDKMKELFEEFVRKE